MSSRHERMKRSIVVENNGFFWTEPMGSSAFPRPLGLPLQNIVPVHRTNSRKVLTDDVLDVVNRFGTISR